eukprot:1159402-Pelagomonas_calceolata.AAC.6
METLLHDGTPYLQEDINMRYVGIAEADYEWVTDQIMQVANRCVYERVCVYVCARVLAHVCCQGRVVSVLEGGYNLQGSIVSPFARSVAAHVRAMGEAHTQEWDPREAEVCLLARALPPPCGLEFNAVHGKNHSAACLLGSSIKFLVPTPRIARVGSMYPGGFRKHNFWASRVNPFKNYIWNPHMEGCRLVRNWVQSERVGGGGWLGGGGRLFGTTPPGVSVCMAGGQCHVCKGVSSKECKCKGAANQSKLPG